MRYLTKLVMVLGFAFSVSSTHADLAWDAPAVDLSDFGIQAGWLVFMYQDVDDNSTLSVMTFDNTGAVVSGAGSDPIDDIWMGASYQTPTVDIGGGLIQFNETILAGWQNTFGGAKVFTVVINSGDWSTATQSRIFDSTPYTLGVTDPHTYTVPSPANDWQTVIPEPGTMALLAMGMLGVGMWRRKVIA